MIEEGIEEQAEEYANKKLDKRVYCSCCQNPDVKQAYKDGWLYRDGAEHRKGVWFVTPDYEIECVGLNSCAGYVNPLFVGNYKSDCIEFIKKEIDGAKWRMEHTTEWHDLKKDPNDLPEEDCTEVMFVTNERETLTGTYKNGGGKGIPIFDTFGIAFYDIEQVIAWCELPQFKE